MAPKPHAQSMETITASLTTARASGFITDGSPLAPARTQEEEYEPSSYGRAELHLFLAEHFLLSGF